MQSLPVSFHDGWQSGQLLSRAMADISTIRRFVGFGLIFLVVNTATFLMVVGLLATLSWPLAVLVALSAGQLADRWAPDFTNCDMSNDPVFTFEKRRVTIYETESWWLVGLTFPSFWRPNQVPVRVGNRVESGFHLLQVWTWRDGIADEVLVLYPADGYWRARPLPPVNLRWSAYGSSFLIGPIETDPQSTPATSAEAVPHSLRRPVERIAGIIGAGGAYSVPRSRAT